MLCKSRGDPILASQLSVASATSRIAESIGLLGRKRCVIIQQKEVYISVHRIALVVFLASNAFVLRTTCAYNPAASMRAAQERSVQERLAADTPEMTPGGVTFTTPSGWSI